MVGFLRSLLFAAIAVGVLLFGSPAMAHIYVTGAPSPVEGADTTLSFVVAHEPVDLTTTKVVIDMPLDTPFASLRVIPKPGWTWAATTAPLSGPLSTTTGVQVNRVVTKVTWTGGSFKSGEAEEFKMILGPLPSDRDQISFNVAQTYSNGETWNWSEPVLEGGPQPKRPAAVLQIAQAGGVDVHGMPIAASDPMGSEGASTRWLAAVALGLSALAFFVTVCMMVTFRR